MARFTETKIPLGEGWGFASERIDMIAAALAQARAEEWEACAKVAEEHHRRGSAGCDSTVAAAIRARAAEGE